VDAEWQLDEGTKALVFDAVEVRKRLDSDSLGQGAGGAHDVEQPPAQPERRYALAQPHPQVVSLVATRFPLTSRLLGLSGG
jgi:hypothetical protein